MNAAFYILQRTPQMLICNQHQEPVIAVLNGDEKLANRIVALLNNDDNIRTLLNMIDCEDESAPRIFAEQFAGEIVNV